MAKPLGLSCCCCSVTQSSPTFCNPMDCSTEGFPVLHHLPELAQTHVHWVGDAFQPSHPLSSESFLMSLCFASSGQSIGVSASASVLPMIIQAQCYQTRFTLPIAQQARMLSCQGLQQREVFFTRQPREETGKQVSDLPLWRPRVPGIYGIKKKEAGWSEASGAHGERGEWWLEKRVVTVLQRRHN